MNCCGGVYSGTYGSPVYGAPDRYENYGRYVSGQWARGLWGSGPEGPSSVVQQIWQGTRTGLTGVAISTPFTLGLTALLYFTGILGERDPSKLGFKDTTSIYGGPITFGGAHRPHAHTLSCQFYRD